MRTRQIIAVIAPQQLAVVAADWRMPDNCKLVWRRIFNPPASNLTRLRNKPNNAGSAWQSVYSSVMVAGTLGEGL
jgi:hypothetical protein